MIYPIWKQGDITLHGSPDTIQPWTERDFTFGVVFPKTVTAPVELHLRSSAAQAGSDEVLANIRLYLRAVPVAIGAWPASDCGVEISFDKGLTWIRFGPDRGAEADPDSWIPLPASAISTVAKDGMLSRDDVASMLLRLTVPPDTTGFGLYRFSLGIDYDVF